MKFIFKNLARLNSIMLPSFTKQRLDLNKATKLQLAILGWRTYITLRALDWFKTRSSFKSWMFKLEKKSQEGVEFLIIWNTDSSSRATLCLSRGGSLEELVYSNTTVITNLSPLSPEKIYPSSILFPFANRIKDGKYNFANKDYIFECNEAAANNALHGLVYNKTFKYTAYKMSSDSARIQLSYESEK